jgi:hypothetical protein
MKERTSNQLKFQRNIIADKNFITNLENNFFLNNFFYTRKSFL